MESVFQSNVQQAAEMLRSLAVFEPAVATAADTIAMALLSGCKLLACGNGGSAADASHLTTEFVCRFNQDRRAYPAISLTAHGGDLTAIGNDYAFEDIFARQIEAFGARGDVLVVFTTTGRSENIRRALVAAKKHGVFSIAMLGRDGGKCAGLADIEFIVRHDVTARIQEAHKLLLHILCELVEIQLAAGKPA
jgi:D-sedoheptulose 7-phosphate isomerase